MAFFMAYGLILVLMCIYAVGFLGLAAGLEISAFELPLSLVISAILFYLSSRTCTNADLRWKIAGVLLLGILLSGVLSAYILDTSWDGQWYHQAAIDKLSTGWNALHTPFYALTRQDTSNFVLNRFNTANYMFVQHYPKFSWITGAVICKCTGYIETAKMINFLIAGAAFSYSCYLLRPFIRKKIVLILVSLLLTLNPVLVTQIFSDYVDGNVAGLLMLILLTLVSLELQPEEWPTIKWIILGSCIVMVSNLKFTGLAFAAVILFVFSLYWIARRQPLALLSKKAGILALFFILAFFVFGYNPYVTNYLSEKDFFYPAREKKAAAMFASNRPPALQGKGSAEKLLISLFSQSANETTAFSDTITVDTANLARPLWKFPFSIHWKEITFFSTPDVRLGGFGPLFQLSLWLSVFLLALTVIRRGKSPFSLLQGAVFLAVLATVLLFPDSWWARFCPLIFILPFICMLPVLTDGQSRKDKPLSLLSGAILVVLLANLVMIATYNAGANIFKTMVIRHEMSMLKAAPSPMKINFSRSLFPSAKRRLEEAGVPFIETDTLKGKIRTLHTRYEFSAFDPKYTLDQ
jgi:hypothetical protein